MPPRSRRCASSSRRPWRTGWGRTVADDVAARVVPFQRYYLCIDGTGTEDSVEYGRLLEEKFGWRNLLTEFLEPPPNPAPGDIDRLLDPNHPFLPIPTFPVAGRKKP